MFYPRLECNKLRRACSSLLPNKRDLGVEEEGMAATLETTHVLGDHPLQKLGRIISLHFQYTARPAESLPARPF